MKDNNLEEGSWILSKGMFWLPSGWNGLQSYQNSNCELPQ